MVESVTAGGEPVLKGKRPNKHVQRREATRAGLLRLGIERFPLKGYAATTIEDIVHDSDYTRGAFYFHFGSKETFFVEVLRWRGNERSEWASRALDPAPATLRDAIAAMVSVLPDERQNGLGFGMLIAEFFQSLPEGSSHLDELRELYAGWLAEAAVWVDAVKELGLARDDLTADEITAAVLAVHDGLLLHRAVYGLEVTPESYVDVIHRMLQP